MTCAGAACPPSSTSENANLQAAARVALLQRALGHVRGTTRFPTEAALHAAEVPAPQQSQRVPGTACREDLVRIADDFDAIWPAEPAERRRGKTAELRGNSQQCGFRLSDGDVDSAAHGVLHLEVLNRADIVGHVDEADVRPGRLAPSVGGCID